MSTTMQEREQENGASSTNLRQEIEELKKAQAVQAATEAGAQATQAAAQAGAQAAQAAATTGMGTTMAAGAANGRDLEGVVFPRHSAQHRLNHAPQRRAGPKGSARLWTR
jgi:hypothetical protein